MNLGEQRLDFSKQMLEDTARTWFQYLLVSGADRLQHILQQVQVVRDLVDQLGITRVGRLAPMTGSTLLLAVCPVTGKMARVVSRRIIAARRDDLTGQSNHGGRSDFLASSPRSSQILLEFVIRQLGFQLPASRLILADSEFGKCQTIMETV